MRQKRLTQVDFSNRSTKSYEDETSENKVVGKTLATFIEKFDPRNQAR